MFLKGCVEAQLGMSDIRLPIQSRYRASPSSVCLSLSWQWKTAERSYRNRACLGAWTIAGEIPFLALTPIPFPLLTPLCVLIINWRESTRLKVAMEIRRRATASWLESLLCPFPLVQSWFSEPSPDQKSLPLNRLLHCSWIRWFRALWDLILSYEFTSTSLFLWVLDCQICENQTLSSSAWCPWF